MGSKQEVLRYIKEIRETIDLDEVHELLSGGGWIAFMTAKRGDGTILFALGRIA